VLQCNQRIQGSLYLEVKARGQNFQGLWLAEIKKSSKIGFIQKKLNSKAATRKDEVECTFFLHGYE
jgi:hypothetical protein